MSIVTEGDMAEGRDRPAALEYSFRSIGAKRRGVGMQSMTSWQACSSLSALGRPFGAWWQAEMMRRGIAGETLGTASRA